MTDTTTESIHALMGRVLADLPAIGKNQQNTQQNYAFRGIDDVLNNLNPILSEHGVFVVPHDIEVIEEPHRTSSRGGAVYVTKIKVRYRFYGPNGDYVEAVGIGEGTDSLDKASPKAMTGAFKYMLFETFAISTQEASNLDADRGSPEQSGGELTVHHCPACASEGRAFQHPDIDRVRSHLVNKHGWTRHDDGRVSPPPTNGEQRPPETSETPQEPEPAPVTPETPAEPARPATDGTTPNHEARSPEELEALNEKYRHKPSPGDPAPFPDPDDLAADLAWVDELKGRALADKAKELGVSASGKVDEVRQRIKDFLSEEPADEPSGDDDESGDESGTDDEAEFECPDCGEGFATEGAYETHWHATHGEGAADGDGATADDDSPASADDIATVKTRISGLTGEAARAYGKYRREAKVGRPDELTVGQARRLLEFLDQLASA